MRFYKRDTPPSEEPVTVDEVKKYARVAHAVEDSIIAQWIKAARLLAENYQHRSYVTQTYRLVYDSFPPECIDFPRPPLVSVESVKFFDEDDVESTFASSNYFVDLISEVGRLALNQDVDYPTVDLRPINAVIIDFTTGYGDAADVPDDVKNAIFLYCTHMYENRESESGSIPKEFFDILRPHTHTTHTHITHTHTQHTHARTHTHNTHITHTPHTRPRTQHTHITHTHITHT